MTTILILGFAYDSWRSKSETFTIYEHFIVMFIISVVITISVYHVVHGVKIGNHVYASPIHVAHCIAGICGVDDAELPAGLKRIDDELRRQRLGTSKT